MKNYQKVEKVILIFENEDHPGQNEVIKKICIHKKFTNYRVNTMNLECVETL